ncbi:unnamed protein product [Microthlaspi erraticum]|uniref:Uncharacterized protein n=1 Tax=Microthlaspi erraticum TaxID=1685480 RepID=A0A6D2HLJ7_9BRAS|nr:unnamed protein product [Microthlaspi erraticum]
MMFVHDADLQGDSMVFLRELINDFIRVEQGWWTKDPNGVWRFFVAEDRLSKGMKIKEGESLLATKEKLLKELHIDSLTEDIELTYQMLSWMDVDGSVKTVPIHIRTNDDLDMFLAMRVDLCDLKLLVVLMAKEMTLDVEDFRVVKPTHGFASAETVLGSEYDREKGILENEGAGELLMLTQRAPDVGESSKSRDASIMALGHVDTLLELHVKINSSNSIHGYSASVFPDSSPSDDDATTDGTTRLTKDLFPMFESEVAAT